MCVFECVDVDYMHSCVRMTERAGESKRVRESARARARERARERDKERAGERTQE